MLSLKILLKIGAILDEGTRAYTAQRITTENIYLLGHPDAQRGEK